jgi:tetratricopeptide (TPR) repeat protein
MQAQREIVNLAYQKADKLRAKGKEHYDEAVKLYLAFLEENPLDGRAAAIHLQIAKMRQEQERYEDAKVAYERCAEKYPNTRQASESRYLIGRLLEGKLFSYEQAIQAYEKVKGPFAGSARQRIAILRRKSLTLETERVFMSDEKPRVKVTTRNLEKLRVRVYKLDLESFYRGTLGQGSIASLAVEVIEPDKTFESQTPDYVKHQESERELNLPFAEQGAYVVKVDGGELEATTLVLVSDITVVSKVSREELFVLAQNTRTHRVAPKTRIVVTDGAKMLAEGETDERGVWRYDGEELQSRNQLYVLASTDEGDIATTLNLSGLTRSRGMQPRYHVYCDRNAYRPGELVHSRAVLRDVEGGVYVLPKQGKKEQKGYALQLFDAAGRMLQQEELELSEFGTLHASFAIPSDARLGLYSIRLYDRDKRTVLETRPFQVAEYSPPRVSLEIEPEQRVIVRGEKIAGVVRARYFFGGPVVGKKVQVTTDIRGPQVLAGETDGAGEFRFEFDSRELWQGASVPVTAQLSEEQARQTVLYRVERTGFGIGLKLPSDVYLQGENLEAKATVESHDGKPLARQLVMELSRLESSSGRVTEIPVARQELSSNAEAGEAFGRFELAQGGKHRLRVYGKDRFEQRIDTSADFFVSGDQDSVKLRLLSAKQYGKVGDKVELRIINRAGPRLCLITYEGDRVLDFETRLLAEGETKLQLELSELHAPNFAFAVTMADVEHKKLHEAKKDFVVTQLLDVKIVPGSTRVEPGGKLSIEIEASDSRGKPVEGEFSLAFVDQAQIDLWGEDNLNLYEVFFGASVQRNTKLRAASSCTFAYKAATRQVNQAIRDAEKQQERQLLEERAKQEMRRFANRAGEDFELSRGRRPSRGRVAADKKAQPMSPPASGAPQTEGGIHVMDLQGFGQGTGMTPGAGGPNSPNPPRLVMPSLQTAQLGFFYDDGIQADTRGRNENFFGQTMSTVQVDSGLPTQESVDVRSFAAASSKWLPSVVTGKDGKARIEIEMPERSAQWRLRVRGVGKGSLFGQARSKLVTAKELLVEAALPSVLTEGDEAELRVDLHNLSGSELDVEWRIEHGKDELAKGEARVAAGGHVERSAKLRAQRVGEERLLVQAKSGEQSDAFAQDFEVLPWGIEERSVRSGRLSGRIDVPLSLPKGEYRSRQLVIELGPDTPEDLFPFGGLRSSRQLCLNRPHFIPPTSGNQAAMGLGALVLLQSYGESAPDAQGRIARLRAQVEGAIATLSASEQNGQFAWLGGAKGRKTFTPESSLVAAYFLMRARQAGFQLDNGVYTRVLGWLSGMQRSRDARLATLAFLARAVDGKGDFARFNSLYRGRSNYALATLGQLALAAHAMGRAGLALELEQAISGKLASEQTVLQAESVSPTEVAGKLWALLALTRAKGHEATLQRGEEWLQKTRRPWGYTNALALALGAEFLATRRKADPKLPGTVTVEVGSFRKVLDFDQDQSRRRLIVPEDALSGERSVITLESSGRGNVVWSALLSGITKELPDPKTDSGQRIVRDYLQAPATHEGKPLPEGFGSIAGKIEQWQNRATAVALGAHIDVQVHYWNSRIEPDQSVVLEEPLPAGCLVRLEDISGNYAHVEMGAGFLRFYLAPGTRATTIRYPLRGFLPGSYRVLPTHVYSLSGKALNLYGKPGKIAVLARGAESPDERRPTPDELLAKGTRLFDSLSKQQLSKGGAERDLAWKFLHELYSKYGRMLKAQPFQQVARRLLKLALVERHAPSIVGLFEALKDRDDSYVLSFEDTAQVADAYYRTGEFEQALRTCKAIAETAFLKEMQIAGTLDRLGERKSSVQFVESLVMSYPGLPTVRGALYSLATALNLEAKELAGSGRAYDPRIGTPLELRRKARQLCYEYLLRYPEDADADEVLFTLASIAIEAEQLDEAIELLQRGAKAHPESDWLDDFLYLEGYAWFEKREREKALALLERVATEEFKNASGRMVKSDSRELALFLQGQIHHAAGDPVRALELYDKVKESFVEAREASDYFRDKELSLPEVKLVKPGEASSLELKARNLGKATVTVYQVDLMRLYLLRKSLSDMGNVQLFGIAPIHSEERDLTSLARFKEHEVKLELPMKDAGAYLVLVRAGELKTSGLLLRTDLEIEAQERPSEARLRVNVKRDGVFLPQADVKVVGAQDGKIRSGETDLRGIYVADDLRGRATVLVKDGESYAFYRSESRFGASPRQQMQQRSNFKQQQKGRFDALRQNMEYNDALQNKARDQLRQLFDNRQKGVEIRRSK